MSGERLKRGVGRTCSFWSVSCLREADRASRGSGGGALRDVRRVAVGANDEETRGEAAERAVAPLAIAGGGEVEGGVLLAGGDALAAVAIVVGIE